MADGESPKGRRIEWIEGNPTDIETRGKQIVDLGDQMVGSAGVLKAVADGATGMEGLSVEKLKDVIGDVHEELKLAGERYSPTGHALTKYATSLEVVQTGLRSIVDDAEQYWQEYQGLPGYIDGQRPVVGMPSPGSPESTALAEDDRAKQAAYVKWEDEAEAFDAKYDTWETAFDDAANSIGRATDGGISDSWKDDIAGFADVALDIPRRGRHRARRARHHHRRTDHRHPRRDRRSCDAGADAVHEGVRAGGLGRCGLGRRRRAADRQARKIRRGWERRHEGLPQGIRRRRGLRQAQNGIPNRLQRRWPRGPVTSHQRRHRDVATPARGTPFSGGDILGRYMGFQNAGELTEAGTRSNGWADILSGHWDVNLKGTVANSVQLFDLLSGDEPPVDSWREQLAQNR